MDDLVAKRREFGQMLGLDQPVSERVMRAALSDEEYAYELVVASQNDDPRILEYWLAQARAPQEPPSTLKLAANATKALLRWGATGFTRVDDETLESRRQACLACPHLAEPESWAQKVVAGSPRSDLPEDIRGKVCRICGCSLAKKIHLPSENCPDADFQPGKDSRWGEPRQE